MLIACALSGCSGTAIVPVAESEASIFSIYETQGDKRINLGDKREDTSELLGIDEFLVVDFEEDNIERVNYHDNPNVYLDYDTDGIVRAIRIEDDRWKISNGLSAGNTVSQIREQYDNKFIHTFKKDGDLWLSYDENGNLMDFDMDSPYIVSFKIEEGRASTIVIQENY